MFFSLCFFLFGEVGRVLDHELGVAMVRAIQRVGVETSSRATTVIFSVMHWTPAPSPICAGDNKQKSDIRSTISKLA